MPLSLGVVWSCFFLLVIHGNLAKGLTWNAGDLSFALFWKKYKKTSHALWQGGLYEG